GKAVQSTKASRSKSQSGTARAIRHSQHEGSAIPTRARLRREHQRSVMKMAMRLQELRAPALFLRWTLDHFFVRSSFRLHSESRAGTSPRVPACPARFRIRPLLSARE